MITAVQYVHERGLLHLDVKPVRAHAGLHSRGASLQEETPAHSHGCASFAPQENFCVMDDAVSLDYAQARGAHAHWRPRACAGGLRASMRIASKRAPDARALLRLLRSASSTLGWR
jgi:hypothetical protein